MQCIHTLYIHENGVGITWTLRSCNKALCMAIHSKFFDPIFISSVTRRIPRDIVHACHFSQHTYKYANIDVSLGMWLSQSHSLEVTANFFHFSSLYIDSLPWSKTLFSTLFGNSSAASRKGDMAHLHLPLPSWLGHPLSKHRFIFLLKRISHLIHLTRKLRLPKTQTSTSWTRLI